MNEECREVVGERKAHNRVSTHSQVGPVFTHVQDVGGGRGVGGGGNGGGRLAECSCINRIDD